MRAAPWFLALMPWLFVWLWSTGFLVAKFGQPYAEPFTLLSMRFAAAMVVLLLIIPGIKLSWLRDRRLWLHSMLVGLMIHGIYLGGVFQAIALGMPAGLSSMVIGLQPLVMVLLAGLMLNERVTVWQWLGLLLGLIGLYLVLGERLALDSNQIFDGFSAWATVLVTASLMAISVGSVYQKKFCQGVNLLVSIWWQYLAAALFCLLMAYIFETRQVDWQWAFVLSLGWQVLALSIGAILLLMLMISLGESARVASLFYLVPPVVAVQAWWWFDEKLGMQALLGVALIALGVALSRSLASRGKRA